MVLLLATSFTMLLSTSAFGQNKSYLQNIPGPNQIDLFSAEILSLVNIIVKETSLFYTEEDLASGIDNANILTLDRILETGLTLETTPANNKRSMLNATGFKENAPSNSNQFSEFIKPLNFSNNILHPFLTPNTNQNFVKESCESIKCLNGKTDWFELNNNGWNTNDKIQQKPAVSSFGNWRFKVRSLENNYLQTPIKL